MMYIKSEGVRESHEGALFSRPGYNEWQDH